MDFSFTPLSLPYTYAANVVRVVDGDTLDLDVDLGFYLRTRLRFRLNGYNAPEMTGVEAPIGVEAQRFLAAMVGGSVRVTTYKGDAFGRWLCDVYIGMDYGVSVVPHLIRLGYGVAWDGKGKRPNFASWATYPAPQKETS